MMKCVEWVEVEWIGDNFEKIGGRMEVGKLGEMCWRLIV